MASKNFRGGEKLQAKLKELSAGLETGATLRVGFLEGGTYPDGTSLPMVAAVHEFGAPGAGIPPRSYFRPAIANKSESWGDDLAATLKGTKYDAVRSLNIVGMVMVGDVQESIANVDSPPLSDITLMLRKMRSENQSLHVTGATVGEAARRVAAGEAIGSVNTKPLQDSGFMKAHVAREVNT